jgi:hypothetical protein
VEQNTKQDEEIASTDFSKFLHAFTSKRQTSYFYSLIDHQERTFNITNYFSQKYVPIKIIKLM